MVVIIWTVPHTLRLVYPRGIGGSVKTSQILVIVKPVEPVEVGLAWNETEHAKTTVDELRVDLMEPAAPLESCMVPSDVERADTVADELSANSTEHQEWEIVESLVERDVRPRGLLRR